MEQEKYFNHKFTCFDNRELVFTLREDRSDYNTVNSCLVADEYELAKIPVDDGDTIIDIGAHVGSIAVFYGSHPKKLKVLAYEPIPENVDMMTKNVHYNEKNEVLVYQKAVTGRIGTTRVYYGQVRDGYSFAHQYIGNQCDVGEGNYIEVPAINLYSIFLEHKLDRVKLIKMDSEGSEFNTLRNTPVEVLNKIDIIVGEHHNCTRAELLEVCRGVFRDEPCQFQNDTPIGQFKFVNKEVKNA